MLQVRSVKVTTVVDNDVCKEGLASSWGLSFYVEVNRCNEKKRTVLMDTGGSFKAFHRNALKLGLDVADVEAVFISHWHGDHYGALNQVLSIIGHPVPVYVPSADSLELQQIRTAGGNAIVRLEPTELAVGAMSTGEMSTEISEHSLIINVRDTGLAVLTGCSHPRIVSILTRAQEVSHTDHVCAVMGGFHISSVQAGRKVGEFIKRMGVEIVSPCHCTGRDAKNEMAKILGRRYVRNGSGKITTIGQRCRPTNQHVSNQQGVEG